MKFTIIKCNIYKQHINVFYTVCTFNFKILKARFGFMQRYFIEIKRSHIIINCIWLINESYLILTLKLISLSTCKIWTQYNRVHKLDNIKVWFAISSFAANVNWALIGYQKGDLNQSALSLTKIDAKCIYVLRIDTDYVSVVYKALNSDIVV